MMTQLLCFNDTVYLHDVDPIVSSTIMLAIKDLSHVLFLEDMWALVVNALKEQIESELDLMHGPNSLYWADPVARSSLIEDRYYEMQVSSSELIDDARAVLEALSICYVDDISNDRLLESLIYSIPDTHFKNSPQVSLVDEPMSCLISEDQLRRL